MSSVGRLACPTPPSNRRRAGVNARYTLQERPAPAANLTRGAGVARVRWPWIRASERRREPARHHGCARGHAPRADWSAPLSRGVLMAVFSDALPPFDLTVIRDGSVATVVVSGELDLATASQLSSTVKEHCDAEVLIVDLTATTFMDSSGVRNLIEADRLGARSRCRLVVVVGAGPVRRVLDLCGLDEQLTITTARPAHRDQPDAMRHRATPAQSSNGARRDLGR
jgi:anti-sigma B factor antagonist